MHNHKPVIIDQKLCNGCGRCVFICSMGVIEMTSIDNTDASIKKKASVIKPEYCMYCEACVIDCRCGAIKLNPEHGSLNIENISDQILKKKKTRP